MKEVLVVGCGGIGSWFVEEIFRLFKNNQLLNFDFSIADYDIVDLKNLLSQNFSEKDLFKSKVKSLIKRYPIFVPIDKEILEGQEILNYECIISCVDTTAFRQLLFETWARSRDLYFIDLRAEGRNIEFVTANRKWTQKDLLATVPGKELKRSCQIEGDLNRGIVECANRCIAQIGAQLFLNWSRGIQNIQHFSMRI